MERPEYRDRSHGYVPTPMTTRETLEPTFHALVGNPYNDRHVTTRVPVALAQADELNRGPGYWWWAQVDPGSAEDPEHWSHFEGWDVRIGLSLRTWNERNVNSWKGRDEIRKTGEWLLTFNDQPVYGGGLGNVPAVLLGIHRRIGELLDLPLDWRKDEDYRLQIEGRKIYYRSTPATLGHWMPDQGAVMIHALEGHRFPAAPYDLDERTGTAENPEHSYSDEWSQEIKDDLLSPHIWWWRRREDFAA